MKSRNVKAENNENGGGNGGGVSMRRQLSGWQCALERKSKAMADQHRNDRLCGGNKMAAS